MRATHLPHPSPTVTLPETAHHTPAPSPTAWRGIAFTALMALPAWLAVGFLVVLIGGL